MTFGQWKETSSVVITMNFDFSSTFRGKIHSHDVTRTTHTNLDVLQESRTDEYWNVNVDRNLSDSWTGFTMFTLLSEKSPKGHNVVPQIRATPRPDYLCLENWSGMSKAAQKKGGGGMGF